MYRVGRVNRVGRITPIKPFLSLMEICSEMCWGAVGLVWGGLLRCCGCCGCWERYGWVYWREGAGCLLGWVRVLDGVCVLVWR